MVDRCALCPRHLLVQNDDGDIKLTVFGLDYVGSKRINNGDPAIKTDGVDSANVYKFKVSADGRAHSEYSITSSSNNKTLVTKKYVDDKQKLYVKECLEHVKILQQLEIVMAPFTFQEVEVYISRISADGIEQSSYQTDDRSSNVRVMVHVRGSDGRVIHSMVSHWYQGVGSNRHIELAVSSRIRKKLSVGQIYYITDGVILINTIKITNYCLIQLFFPLILQITIRLFIRMVGHINMTQRESWGLVGSRGIEGPPGPLAGLHARPRTIAMEPLETKERQATVVRKDQMVTVV